MNYTLSEWFSYSVGIGAVIGLVRINKIDRAYLPFIILLWFGLFTEIISTYCIKSEGSNAVVDNIYGLVEGLLILWFFRRQRLFEKRPALFWIFFASFCVGWLVDKGWTTLTNMSLSLNVFCSYYNIGYSFCIVLMSIHFISQLIVKEKNTLKRNSSFLIAIGFITLLTIKIIVEIFWVYGLYDPEGKLSAQVYAIHTWMNLVVNLLFGLAVLWIPSKRTYTLQ